MLGYSLANGVNLSAAHVGIENDVSSLWANQIKGCLVTFQNIRFSLDIFARNHRAVSIYGLVALKSISCGHDPAGFKGGADGI